MTSNPLGLAGASAAEIGDQAWAWLSEKPVRTGSPQGIPPVPGRVPIACRCAHRIRYITAAKSFVHRTIGERRVLSFRSISHSRDVGSTKARTNDDSDDSYHQNRRVLHATFACVRP